MPELDEGGTRVPSQPPPPRATDGLSYTERYRGTEYDSSGVPAKEEGPDPLAGIASAVRSLFGGRGQPAPAEAEAPPDHDAADPDDGLIDAPGRPAMAESPAPRPRFGAPADLLTAPPAAERTSYVEYGDEEAEWDEDRPLAAAAQPMAAPQAPPPTAPSPMDEAPLPPPAWAQPRTQAPLPPADWAQPAQAQAAQAQAPLPPPDWAQMRRPPKPTAARAPAQSPAAAQAPAPAQAQPARPPARARQAPRAAPVSPAPAEAAQAVARASTAPAQPAQPVARAPAAPAQPAQQVARASAAAPAQPAQVPAATTPATPPQPARKPPRGSVISRQPAALPPAPPASQVARQSAASARAAELRAAEQLRAAEAARISSMRGQAAMPPLRDEEDETPFLLDDEAADIPYSERYRGTEWDPNAQPAGRGLGLASLTRRAVPIAIVLVLVVGGIGAVAMFGRGIIEGLTGSGEPEPGGAKVIAQFRELADTRDLPFHVAMTTTITGGNKPIEVQAEMDMVDGDSAGTVTFTEAGARIALEMVVKGGATYARVPGAPWQIVPLKQQGIVSPLTELGAPTGYEDLGLEERNGVSLRHLRTTESGRDDLDALIELFGDVATIRSSVMDLYLTEEGVPVEMTGSATMSLNQSGKTKQATLTFSYRFSQVGKTLEITAPV